MTACVDENMGETVRGSGVLLNRAIGCTHIEDFAQTLRQFVSFKGGERSMKNFGILCPGRSVGLKLLRHGAVLYFGDLAR